MPRDTTPVVGTLDDFCAALRSAGVTSVRLDFGPATVEGVPRDAAAAHSTAGVAESNAPPIVTDAEAERVAAERRAAEEAAQAEEDRFAASNARPNVVTDLMRQCDEEFGAWQSEQVAAHDGASVLVLERVSA